MKRESTLLSPRDESFDPASDGSAAGPVGPASPEAVRSRSGEAFPVRAGRAEGIIAAGRLALAGLSLLAVWLDPADPARFARVSLSLLCAYALFSAGVVALLAGGGSDRGGRLALPCHLVDLLAATAVMVVTQGSASPFFAFFVFALVSATLRWQKQGAVWTGAAAFAALLFLGASSAVLDPQFELNRFLVRGGYLAVAAGLLAYLGAHEERTRADLARLAAWRREVAGSRGEVLEAALAEAAAVLRAPRAALVWEEAEEPWCYLALWSPEGFEELRLPPGTCDLPVAPELAGRDWLWRNRGGLSGPVLLRSCGGLVPWQGAPLHPGVAERLFPGSLLGIALAGEEWHGVLLAVDKPDLGGDDLTLGEVVGRQVLAELEQFRLQRAQVQGAAAEERLHLARDLHDGVVQALAAAGLKLEAVHSLVAGDPAAARAAVREVQELLAEEQRGLRTIARALPVPRGIAAPPEPRLAARLAEVGERVQSQWGLAVALRAAPGLGTVPGALAQEVCRMVYEALVNAVRHGRACAARVEVERDGGELRVCVADDGRGFSFCGAFDLEELAARKIGPLALRERVASLKGRLRVESAPAGARLDIALPIAPGGTRP